MKDWKTTFLGALKIIGASVFVAFKLAYHLPFSDAEAGVVLLAFGSGVSGLVSADAKKEPPQ